MRRGGRVDDDAYVEFATTITPRLFRSALMLCGDWHLAEDLVQTTLGKLYANWHRVAAADSPEAYARGALTKEFLSHRRLRRSHEVAVADADGSNEERTEDRTSRLVLLDALRELAPLDRAVLVLRYWEDRSVNETATVLGISEGAVRTRANRALPKLRKVLTGTEATA
jgi:RNA polymerase sigma-70 factor (sigma-E family)